MRSRVAALLLLVRRALAAHARCLLPKAVEPKAEAGRLPQDPSNLAPTEGKPLLMESNRFRAFAMPLRVAPTSDTL
jgi:hypothetical protein